MGCGSSSVEDDNNALCKHEGWSSIKEKKRGCTDCLLLFVLLAAWLAMTVVGFAVCGVYESPQLKKGNPARLTNALDYQGHICGYDGFVKHKPYGYYLLDESVVCVSSCPTATNYQAYVCQYDSQALADSSTLNAIELLATKKCMVLLESQQVLNRCIPNMAVSAIQAALASQNITSYVPSSAGGGSSWFNSFLGDLYTLRGLVFGFGLGVSTFLAFMYLYLLRIPGLLFVMIWSIILSIQALFVVGSFLLWSLATTWSIDHQHTKYEILTMQVFAYVGMGLSVLYFCLVLIMRKRVELAIGVVKEAAKALATMPILITMPIIQVIGCTIFLVPWTIYVLYLASSGDMVNAQGTYTYNGITQQYSYRTFSYDKHTKYAFLYMLFCWFWTSEFLIAIGQLVVALSVTCWYFTKDKSTLGNSTVLWAFKAVFFNHLGTAAFGSLIIAIVKTIRAVIAYFQNQAKRSKNKIMEYVLCMVQCCMWCVEKCLKFLNKNAYIQTAIYGYSFCKAARKAFFLLLRNILRVAAVNLVADFLLFLGKLFVPILTTFICYLVVAYGVPSNQISGLVAPLVVVWILSYFTSVMFTEIFSMGIETILCCFIADEEMFPPADRFAEDGLKSTLQKTAQAAAAANIAKVAPQENNMVSPVTPPTKPPQGERLL